MTNLVVCCDGTWNHPENEDDGVDAPTNVFILSNAVKQLTPSVDQKVHYQAGVGTEGLADKVAGGLVGAGISDDIKDCYLWLADNYKQNDKIFLFGFSRGAFAVRSLAGMLERCGLLDLSGLSAQEMHDRVDTAYRYGYRKKQPVSDWTGDSWAIKDLNPKVHFLGVWDTVGALGVPDDKTFLNLFDSKRKYAFHDIRLGEHIKHARHALALDEVRGSFTPTRWQVTDHTDAKEMWFAGVHSDIGGGYAEDGLSNIALKWMLEEAESKGLEVEDGFIQNIETKPLGKIHNSYKGFFKALVPVPRAIPNLSDLNLESIHTSVYERQTSQIFASAKYRPSIRLALNEVVHLKIVAKEQWNWTGLYAKPGDKYAFEAKGIWYDKSIPCTAKGMKDGEFHIGELFLAVGSAMGWLENKIKRIIRNEQADFLISKRYEKFDWFSLVGAVPSSKDPSLDGTHKEPEVFMIGENLDKQFTDTEEGYMYCFANDAWGFYSNNRGTIDLTIKRIG